MMFSVFLQPVFLSSHSTMSNYLDQKLRALVAGWVEQRLSPRLHQAGSAEPPAPSQQCGLSGWPQALCCVIAWCWDRVLRVVFSPNDQNPTEQ